MRARVAYHDACHLGHAQGVRTQPRTVLRTIPDLEVVDIPVADARGASEMLLIGSSVRVAPIVEWDGRPIGTGRPGPIAKALLDVVDEDMRTGDRLIEVPYEA